MGIVENVKEVAELVQKVGNLDLSKRIIELEHGSKRRAGHPAQLIC